MRFPALAVPALAAPALTASITLYLPPVPNPFTLPASTHATLSTLGSAFSAPISALNAFVFHNVTPGSYLADIHCKTDGFRPLRIDVARDADGKETFQAWDTFRGNEWGNKGEALPVKDGSAGWGVEAKSLGKKMYFVDRPQFSVLSILKNPMILMGLVSMLIFFGMPKLMENMDPDLKAEFEARQREGPMAAMSGQQQNPLGNFDMAAFLAGSGKKEGGAGAGSVSDGRNEPVRR
ncbi:ER membrane protein complex subunit 7 [Metarhizium anisopliae]|nr:ER membrane protein complex subunit 7 [Metarhizium anisopliae]